MFLEYRKLARKSNDLTPSPLLVKERGKML
jgi:hypothetical protein